MATVTIDKEDKALQYKMAISSFLKSPGFKIFKEAFDEMVEYSKAQTQIQDAKGHVDMSGLCLLNYNLGYDAGLKVVSNILVNYQEELIGSEKQK